ncbi:MAG: DapH/DapD/GlmU-related protein [bacterium]
MLIERGCTLGTGVSIEDHATIETGAHIGAGSFVVQGARVGANAEIGPGCVLAGFLAERSVVGRNSRISGSLLHRHDSPHINWDDYDEPAPTIGDQVFIATGAMVIGPVSVGSHSYVAAGAIVTKDVPPRTIVLAVNEQTPIDAWRGRLRNTLAFGADDD